MIYKYTKCEPVIAKIMADAGLEEDHLRITDIKEWIFEAVEKIGAPVQYITRESGVDGCPILEIKNRQVPMPDDVVHLSTVAYSTNPNGPWEVVRYNSKSFREDPHPCCECCEEQRPPMPVKSITATCQLYGINGTKYLERAIANGEKEDVQYFIKPGWIVLNRKKGFIRLSYKAIPTDENGYPLIPDIPSFQEAVYWYVLMKLNFPRFLAGNFIRANAAKVGMQTYFYLQQQWNNCRNHAYAEAIMPNESQMINIKNEWNKLVPEWDSDENLFNTEGEKQLNFHDYYYGY